jgi:protein TonB
MSRERIIGLGLVGLLHVLFIYALATGLAQKIITNVPKELKAEVVAQPQEEVKTTQPPPPTMIVPKNSITPPEIKVETNQQAAIQQPMAPAAPSTAATPDTRASGVSSTHTTPPYPGDAKEKGHEGTVTLHIMISAQGDVTNATVTKSSGFPELDQQAVSWVTSHWKYKPATAKGTAVASASDAQVVFSLKNANG